GTATATAECCERMRPNGTLLLLAAFWNELTLPGIPVAAKELAIVTASMYGRLGAARDVDTAAALLAANPAIAECLITHRFPLAQAPEAFAAARDRKAGAIKVVLEPGAGSLLQARGVARPRRRAAPSAANPAPSSTPLAGSGTAARLPDCPAKFVGELVASVIRA